MQRNHLIWAAGKDCEQRLECRLPNVVYLALFLSCPELGSVILLNRDVVVFCVKGSVSAAVDLDMTEVRMMNVR